MPRRERGARCRPSSATAAASRDRVGHDRLSVIRDHLEHGQLGRVSRERGRRARLRSTPITIAARSRAAWRGDERVDVDALEQPADDPHDPAEAAQRRLGGVRVRRLRVVDPADAAGDGDHLDAVRVERGSRASASWMAPTGTP